MRIAVIQARDHFSTDDPTEKSCIVLFIGEIIEETDIYIRLRHIKANLYGVNSAEEYHCVLKSAIHVKHVLECPIKPLIGT